MNFSAPALLIIGMTIFVSLQLVIMVYSQTLTNFPGVVIGLNTNWVNETQTTPYPSIWDVSSGQNYSALAAVEPWWTEPGVIIQQQTEVQTIDQITGRFYFLISNNASTPGQAIFTYQYFNTTTNKYIRPQPVSVQGPCIVPDNVGSLNEIRSVDGLSLIIAMENNSTASTMYTVDPMACVFKVAVSNLPLQRMWSYGAVNKNTNTFVYVAQGVSGGPDSLITVDLNEMSIVSNTVLPNDERLGFGWEMLIIEDPQTDASGTGGIFYLTNTVMEDGNYVDSTWRFDASNQNFSFVNNWTPAFQAAVLHTSEPNPIVSWFMIDSVAGEYVFDMANVSNSYFGCGAPSGCVRMMNRPDSTFTPYDPRPYQGMEIEEDGTEELSNSIISLDPFRSS